MHDLPWPFLGAEALANRLIPERAMRASYQPVYPDVFVPRGVELTARQRAEAAWLWSGRRGVVAGSSAAAMLGAQWVDGGQPAELIHDNPRPPRRLVTRNETLGVDESFDVGPMCVTTSARTGSTSGGTPCYACRRCNGSMPWRMPPG
ncbi:hypothetical protein MMAD_48390 [Mycolicibacterium madagascariense]|uniref:Uncharacterized protein n=1 Tax=Mycolicibacterium madagascariense TaxID=212765 RepID=A0A7I7XMW3_9MYCO|nr:hypothetical protein MMAD_48390 [Mycolicibacterium madagascariense]